MKRPKKGEFAPFHETYLNAVPSTGSALSLLKNSFKNANAVFAAIADEKADYAYAEGKWTILQMLMHIIDTERVFAYRTLSFMRGDKASLPGFNQDHWMEQVNVAGRTIKDLLKEWKMVRENTIYLLKQCTEEQSKFKGVASGFTVTPRAYFFIIIGHQNHHIQILQEKYL
jgi:uncharacterized damage-inducible protein DinB